MSMTRTLSLDQPAALARWAGLGAADGSRGRASGYSVLGRHTETGDRVTRRDPLAARRGAAVSRWRRRLPGRPLLRHPPLAGGRPDGRGPAGRPALR